MKKEKSVKTKTNNSKKESCKPFFDNKKLLTIAIASFFIFAFLLNFANVTETNATITGQPVAEGFIAGMFADWTTGNLDINIAKYLFWIILTLFIFSALNFAKIPNNSAAQWLIAIPVSFLSVAYITPEEIFTVLTAYSALGLTLSVIVPFVIMIFFSAMLISNEKLKHMSVAKIMLEVSLWLFFIAFLIYKLIVGYGKGISMSSGVTIVMFIVLGLSLLVLIFNKGFRKWIRNIGVELRKAKGEVQRVEREQEREAGKSAE